MKKLNEDLVPATLNEAIDYLYSVLEDKEIKYIHEKPSISVHFSFGMDLRNFWSLWQDDTPIKKDIQKRFNLWGMGDDVSALILSGLWAKVKGLNIEEELNKMVEKCRNHWLGYCIDPATGKEIKDCKRDNKKIIHLEDGDIKDIEDSDD